MSSSVSDVVVFLVCVSVVVVGMFSELVSSVLLSVCGLSWLFVCVVRCCVILMWCISVLGVV